MTAIDIKETPSATTSELAAAFDEWLDGLDTPQATLTKHNMEILAKSMRKSMAFCATPYSCPSSAQAIPNTTRANCGTTRPRRASRTSSSPNGANG